jgi:hypothetical protein
VPGNFSASIDIEDLRTISRTLFNEGALSGGIDRRMLKQDQGIWAITAGHLAMDAPLNRQCIFILD